MYGQLLVKSLLSNVSETLVNPPQFGARSVQRKFTKYMFPFTCEYS